MRLLLLVPLIAGCFGGSGFNLETKTACPVDFVSWGGGLTANIAAGTGDGSFDYDPPSEIETRVFGNYELNTGDFAFSVEYVPAHYREETRVEGYGYANENGDLDLVATYTTTDSNGESWVIERREQRVGCVSTIIEVDDAGNVATTEGQYSATAFSYERTVGEGSDAVVVEGELLSDLSFTESYSFEDGEFSFDGETTGDSSGYSRTDWTQGDSSADWEASGFDEYFVDGTWHQQYDYEGGDGDYEWDVEVDYSGNGSGTVDGSGYACDVEYDDWSCTIDCGDGPTSC